MSPFSVLSLPCCPSRTHPGVLTLENRAWDVCELTLFDMQSNLEALHTFVRCCTLFQLQHQIGFPTYRPSIPWLIHAFKDNYIAKTSTELFVLFDRLSRSSRERLAWPDVHEVQLEVSAATVRISPHPPAHLTSTLLCQIRFIRLWAPPLHTTRIISHVLSVPEMFFLMDNPNHDTLWQSAAEGTGRTAAGLTIYLPLWETLDAQLQHTPQMQHPPAFLRFLEGSLLSYDESKERRIQSISFARWKACALSTAWSNVQEICGDITTSDRTVRVQVLATLHTLAKQFHALYSIHKLLPAGQPSLVGESTQR